MAVARLPLILALALPVAAGAQSFAYAPGSSQYRVTQSTKIAQTVMGQVQEFETSSNQVMSVTLASVAKDTMSMAIVMDSIQAIGPMGTPAPGLETLRGLKVDVRLSPAGHVYAATGPDNAAANAATIVDGMKDFLPKIRRTLARGATWTDTVAGQLNQMGIAIDRRTVATYTVAGDTTVNGAQSWKIARTAATSLSGSGTGPNGAMTMEGTGTADGTIYVTRAGAFAGADGTEKVDIKIVISATGMEVAVAQQATTKVEKVR